MRWTLRGLILFGVLGFLLASGLQGAMRSRATLVQWVDGARLAPVGEPEPVLLGPVPRLKGSGPEGSVFVALRYRTEGTRFATVARTFLLGRIGAVGAIVAGFAGLAVLRLQRIGLGRAPD